jgi:hypothetical protein
MKRKKPSQFALMRKGIEAMDEVLKSDDRVAQTTGAIVGVATPPTAIAATGAITGVSGGAAVLKTLAIAGSVVGGGAVAGVVVVGVGAVVVGWATTRVVRAIRDNRSVPASRPPKVPK